MLISSFLLSTPLQPPWSRMGKFRSIITWSWSLEVEGVGRVSSFGTSRCVLCPSCLCRSG
jgi:hypothetical protein